MVDQIPGLHIHHSGLMIKNMFLAAQQKEELVMEQNMVR